MMYLGPPAHRDQRLEGAEVWKSKLEEERLEEEVETATAITAKRSVCRNTQHEELLGLHWKVY